MTRAMQKDGIKDIKDINFTVSGGTKVSAKAADLCRTPCISAPII